MTAGLRTRSQWEAPHRRAIHPFIAQPGICRTGEEITIVLHEDILTERGQVVASAGTYEARRLLFGTGLDGAVISSPDHFAGANLEVHLPCHLWSFPGEPSRGYPPHSCWDYVANGVRGGLFCGCCQAVLGGSLLTAKYRNAGPHAQIQNLCRIGNRALKHADWIEELVTTRAYGYRDEASIAAGWLEIERSRAKAAAAASEMLTIAREHGIRPGHLQVVR